MKHIVTLNQANLKKSAAKGGCGECQASWPVCLQNVLHGCQSEV